MLLSRVARCREISFFEENFTPKREERNLKGENLSLNIYRKRQKETGCELNYLLNSTLYYLTFNLNVKIRMCREIFW